MWDVNVIWATVYGWDLFGYPCLDGVLREGLMDMTWQRLNRGPTYKAALHRHEQKTLQEMQGACGSEQLGSCITETKSNPRDTRHAGAEKKTKISTNRTKSCHSMAQTGTQNLDEEYEMVPVILLFLERHR